MKDNESESDEGRHANCPHCGGPAFNVSAGLFQCADCGRDIPYSDNGQSFDEWLTEKLQEASDSYRGGRSENPRQSDIALGKLRAYRNARTEYLNRKQNPSSCGDGKQ
jgi:ribosomal protein L37E